MKLFISKIRNYNQHNKSCLEKKNKVLQHNNFLKSKWSNYGQSYTVLPNQGLDEKDLLILTEHYKYIILNNIQENYISGTIYPPTLYGDDNENLINFNTDTIVDNFQDMNHKVKKLLLKCYNDAYLWNSRDLKHFDLIKFIEYQTGQIVASMFKSTNNQVKTLIVDNYNILIRCYRNWAKKQRNHKIGSSIIVAPDTVNRYIIDACNMCEVKLMLIKTDSRGIFNPECLISILKKYKNKIILIIGSAPSITGVVDPIELMSNLAYQYGCGMHVDLSLGGFIINFLPQYHTNYLDWKGVSSINIDIDKNGLAPHNCSVLITKGNLLNYGLYNFINPPAISSYASLLTMLSIGKYNYQNIAFHVHNMVSHLSDLIKQYSNSLNILIEPQINILILSTLSPWPPSLIYSFSANMRRHNIFFDDLSNNRIAFCITCRHINQPFFLEDFKTALDSTITKTFNNNNIHSQSFLLKDSNISYINPYY